MAMLWCGTPLHLVHFRPKMTAYVRHHTLRNGHSDAINCIAFSPSRLYLATGGDDNCIIIWRLEDHTFIYRLMFESPVDALLWLRIPAGSESLVGKDILFSGCRHGLISEASSFRLVRTTLLNNENFFCKFDR